MQANEHCSSFEQLGDDDDDDDNNGGAVSGTLQLVMVLQLWTVLGEMTLKAMEVTGP